MSISRMQMTHFISFLYFYIHIYIYIYIYAYQGIYVMHIDIAILVSILYV